jgi:hypothetical protein
MRGPFLLGATALAASLAISGEAAADRGDGELWLGDALVAGSGIAASVQSQVSLIEGEPDTTWGTISLGAAGANAVMGTLLLLVGQFSSDSDERLGYSIAGGVQVAIAGACLVSGVVAVAAGKPASADTGSAPAALRIRVAF